MSHLFASTMNEPSSSVSVFSDKLENPSSTVSRRDIIQENVFPKSFTSNSDKEKKLLLYVKNFQRQFHLLFGLRVEPFMVCDNEAGLQKMVCSFVRPTVMKYDELSTWNGCAEFVADYLAYSPLLIPTKVPKYMDSPSAVIARKQGHCFEYSSVLCSFLIGAGYDAYVVNGYATQDVCSLVLERENCPIASTVTEEEPVTEEKAGKKYLIKALKEEYRSKFDEKMIKKQLAQDKKLIEAEREEEFLRELKAQEPPADLLQGKRVHCWVLVKKGKREIGHDFFLEPTKGWRISLENESYLGIESVWNNVNYWVNMQLSKSGGIKGFFYDLDDEGLWESFLPYLESDMYGSDAGRYRNDPKQCAIEQEHLDMPQSWATPIEISARDLLNRFPNGEKSELYKYKKVEKFVPFLKKDGLILRMCHYKTWDRKELQLIEEHFQQRVDQLYYKVHNLVSGLVTEYFNPGQPNALKEHTYQANDTSLQANRSLIFYKEKRADGLAVRKIQREEMQDIYDGQLRMDHLCFRRTWFGARIKKFGALDSTRRQIVKVHEKYIQQKNSSQTEEIAEIIYKIAERKIKVIFHRMPGRIAASWREFTKEPITDEHRDFHKDFSLDSVKEYQADPSDRKITRLEAYLQLLDLVKSEMQVLNKVRDDENELVSVLTDKMKEDQAHNLYCSPYNVLKIESTRIERLKKEKEELEEKQSQEKDQDYLFPYLLRYDLVQPQILSMKQTQIVAENCLTDFKKQLMDRFLYIKRRHEEEATKLQELQNWYQQNQFSLTRKDEQEYSQKNKEISFVMQMIELRLSQHKESAPQKYLELEKKLRNDPRLFTNF